MCGGLIPGAPLWYRPLDGQDLAILLHGPRARKREARTRCARDAAPKPAEASPALRIAPRAATVPAPSRSTAEAPVGNCSAR
jgi:hypothetical protein